VTSSRTPSLAPASDLRSRSEGELHRDRRGGTRSAELLGGLQRGRQRLALDPLEAEAWKVAGRGRRQEVQLTETDRPCTIEHRTNELAAHAPPPDVLRHGDGPEQPHVPVPLDAGAAEQRVALGRDDEGRQVVAGAGSWKLPRREELFDARCIAGS